MSHSSDATQPVLIDTEQETNSELLDQSEGLRWRVAELEAAQADLQVSETRYRRLFETAQDGILILDADTGQITDVNPFLKEILGYAREDLMGKRLWEIGPFKDISASQDAFAELQHLGYIRYESLPLERSDGQQMEVEFVSNVYRVDDHRVIQCNIRDITDRKRHEREIESVAALGAALRNTLTRGEMLPVIVHQVNLLFRADGTALLMRDPLTDQPMVVMAGGDWTSLTGTRLPAGQGLIDRPITNRQSATEQLLTRPDIFQMWQVVAGMPLLNQGQTLGAIWIGRQTELNSAELHLLHVVGEIAANALYRVHVIETLEERVAERTHELAEANAHLQELDRLKDEFLSNINHELRTPFANLKLYLYLLERGRTEKRAEYVQTLQREMAHLEKVIEDVLDFSQVHQTVTQVDAAACEVDPILSGLISARSAVAAEYGLALTYAPHLNSLAVVAHPRLLSHALSNLLTNAIQYTPVGGAVSVSCTVAQDQARDWVVVSVQDSGPGISAADAPHVFERFYRGEVGHKSHAPGLGLGLAVSKAIVEEWGGRITVVSRPDHGTTFKVWLLRAPSA